MTHYSDCTGHVKGELFTKNGKWKYTVVIDMTNYYDELPIDEAIVTAIRNTPAELRGVVDWAVGLESVYILVVDDPYHTYAHPQMLMLWKYGENNKYSHLQLSEYRARGKQGRIIGVPIDQWVPCRDEKSARFFEEAEVRIVEPWEPLK